MTTVSPATTTSTTTASSSTKSSSALSSMTSNFETFLNVFITELKNQDPSSPTDTSEYVSQLSQMCSVEAQLETNSKLDSLISQGESATNASAVDYIGKTITVANGEGALSSGTCTWNYTLASAAANTTLTVTDASGNTVYTKSGDTAGGKHALTWDGTKTDGSKAADGTYTLSVTSTDSSGTKVTSSVSYSGKVTAVDTSGSTTELVVGSADFALSDVSSVSAS